MFSVKKHTRLAPAFSDNLPSAVPTHLGYLLPGKFSCKSVMYYNNRGCCTRQGTARNHFC